MTLGEMQRLFAVRVAELIHRIQAAGYECSFGEVKRSDEQAIINAIGEGGRAKLAAVLRNNGFASLGDAVENNGKFGGVLYSVHQLQIAVDLNLFKDGKYLATSEDHKLFGE